MRAIPKALLAAALVVGVAGFTLPGSGSAKAEDFYINGPGFHVGVGDRHHWREREYRRDRDGYRYRRGYGAYAADPGHPYGYYHNYGDPRCGRPNFTIQDGVCKPYTGR